MILSAVNKNYCAVVVALEHFVPLPNCNNVQGVMIFNNHVIVGKDVQPGAVGLFFPVETALSKEFLGANNLFRKPEHGNVNPEAKGYFEEHGRVKAVKFRGHKSEGIWLPMSCLDWLWDTVPDDFDVALTIGVEFDELDGHEICRKYIRKYNRGSGEFNKKLRSARVEDRIVDGQFRLHYDTENLRRNAHKILPTDTISVSDKWHGTSAVFANLLTKRKLNWFERLLQRFGIHIEKHSYGTIWSSRRVIKGVDGVEKSASVHYYSEDIWGVVARELEGRVPIGYTIYGEIVGFTPSGGPIQKGYHYGCRPKEHKLVVYRVTSTNPDGVVLELGWKQMRGFCAAMGLNPVLELYHGDLCSIVPRKDQKWEDALLEALESQYIHDADCPYNNNEVPAEGVVVRVDHFDHSEAYKLKNFRFLSHETKALDKGDADMEAEEEALAQEER